ncbi:hypothetical protein V2J09_017108 [Rumex salicifolius]
MDWTSLDMRAFKRAINNIDARLQRVAVGVAAAQSLPLAVEGQARRLIIEAVSHKNLGKIFEHENTHLDYWKGSMDPARRLLQDFMIYREQHPSHTGQQIFRAAVEANALLWVQVSQRPQWVGEVPEIGEGEVFRYCTELMLAGFHDARVPGICVGHFLVDGDWLDVATCVVAKYGCHNYNFDAHILAVHCWCARILGPQLARV